MALHFELVTPARLVRSEDVHMVVVPGTEGDFGVLEGHAPVMSTIRDGAIQVFRTEGGQPENIEVRGLPAIHAKNRAISECFTSVSRAPLDRASSALVKCA